MGKKKFFVVLDTETTGEIPHQIAYDVGWVVCDREGHIYERQHFLVREVFANLQMMATAFYANKFVGYLDRLSDGEITALPFGEILRQFDKTREKYDGATLAAYNLNFDLRAMSNTCDWLYDNRNWYRGEMEHLCIMCAACDVLYTKRYIQVCREHGWETEKGNVKTSAECGYRYVSGNYDFEEEHRGADDCEIEAQILAAIFKLHRKFDGTPKSFPFRKVYAREFE